MERPVLRPGYAEARWDRAAADDSADRTYDATTHAFALTWKSLIVGGPFNGFTGAWHLAETFVPESSSSPGGLLPPIPKL